MNKKRKNIELKIYELLGIKTFRKIFFKLVYIFIIPFTLKMTKEERYNCIYNTPNNYNMKKGHEIQDLKDFKKKLLFNAGIHISALMTCIPYFLKVIESSASFFTTITILFWIPTNIYCIMLQRYNQIRINQVIKKGELREEVKKSKLKEELIKEDSLLSEHTYKVVNKRNKEKNITFEQLKQYRDHLSDFKEINQMMEEQPIYFTLDEQLSNSVPLQKNKTLKLELKSRKQDEGSN